MRNVTHPPVLHLGEKVRQQLAKVLHHEGPTSIHDTAKGKETTLASLPRVVRVTNLVHDIKKQGGG